MLYASSASAYGVRSTSQPLAPNCGASYMPIITTSNCSPPAPTSRVTTSRRVPSSSTVYSTSMPVSAVNRSGVSAAMSSICGLPTIATLSWRSPDADADGDSRRDAGSGEAERKHGAHRAAPDASWRRAGAGVGRQVHHESPW